VQISEDGSAKLIKSNFSRPDPDGVRGFFMPIRIVQGEIDTKDVTTRVILPTVTQPRWPPFERVAETIATPRRPFPPHRHEKAEVLTYVIEGSAFYAYGPSTPEPLGPGSTRLLTAPTGVSHAINPGKGQTVRWFSIVATLTPGAAPSTRLQSGSAIHTEIQPDGTVLEQLVGPRASLTSAAGLECEVVRFVQEGTAFRRVGHGRIAVIYALSGPGSVDNDPLDAGEAALVDEAAGVALKGAPGFQVIFSTAPRPSRG
jgi:redox-sensitive bicupin YhaK (pirin superfamily)